MAKSAFYVGDVADGCPEIEDESCDLIVTSPPYFKRNGYSDELMSRLGDVFGRVLKPGGRAYVIIAQIKEKLDRPYDAQREIMIGSMGKLAPGQTIIWVKSIAMPTWKYLVQEELKDLGRQLRKHEASRATGLAAASLDEIRKIIKGDGETVSRGHFQPINSKNLLNYCWEYVISFVKKPESSLLPLGRKAKGVGVAYADLSNVKRWKNAADAVHCPGDVLFVPYETTGATTKKMHRHEFPLELARKLIKVSGIPKGSTVFDPFVGGGTTCYAASSCGMKSLGYDLSEKTVVALRRAWTVGINDLSGNQISEGDKNEEDSEHS